MAGPVVLCTDGSELASRALAAGLELVRHDGGLVVVMVIEPPDPTLVSGTGFAGGAMSVEELEELDGQLEAEAAALLDDTVTSLGLTEAETRVLRGTPGPTICDFARDEGAAAIVLGTRGRGGVKRALLGSVSDHVVRNGPCPVVVTGAGE